MNTEAIYNIDYNKLINWLLPNRLKQSRIVAYLTAMIYPFQQVYQNFLRFRKQTLYNLMITPQVCYLELMLNDRYDYTQRRIVIVDGLDEEPIYLFVEEELKPVYLFIESENKPLALYTDGEAGLITDDFIIRVPNDVVFADAEMTSLIKKFKLAGIKFSIQRV